MAWLAKKKALRLQNVLHFEMLIAPAAIRTWHPQSKDLITPSQVSCQAMGWLNLPTRPCFQNRRVNYLLCQLHPLLPP